MSHDGWVQDTLPICWKSVAEMILSAIRKLANPLWYQVAIHCTIGNKGVFDSQCLAMLTKHMLAMIGKSFWLLNVFVKCISPQESSVLLTLSLPTSDQYGVHSPTVSKWVVFLLPLLILSTSWSSTALQSVPSDVLDLVELDCPQFGWHALITSQNNTQYLHHTLPLLSYRLDL